MNNTLVGLKAIETLEQANFPLIVGIAIVITIIFGIILRFLMTDPPRAKQ